MKKTNMSSSVIESFKGLNVSSAQDASDHEAIFEVLYQYLSKIKNLNDLTAFHNCLVALINCDKYYKALELLREVPAEVHREYPLEKAYVYYKTGNNDLVVEVYEAAKDEVSDVLLRALKHVLAQSYYQAGQMHKALDVYRELIAANTLDSTVDLACNERAILSQLALEHTFLEPTQAPEQRTYDIVFNEALYELGRNNTAQSLLLLEEAATLCTAQNADLDPADSALEIAPIRLTTAYIYATTGRSDDAQALLDLLDMAAITDLMTHLVFRTNYVALGPSDANVNFAARELNYQRNLHQLRHKLTRQQARVLLKNHLLLAYQSNAVAAGSSYLSPKFYAEFARDYPGDVTPLVFRVLIKLHISLEDLEAPSLRAVSRKVLKFALGELENGVSDVAVAAALLLVSLNGAAAKYDQLFLVLEKIAELELAGAALDLHASVFGVLICLYELHNSAKKVAELYDALVAKFAALSAADLADARLYNFVRAVAFKLLSIGRDTELFEKLHAANADDAVVASALSGDHSQLKPAEELASAEDVEQLLAVDVKTLVSVASTAPKSARAAEFRVKKKNHKPKFSKHKFFKPEHDFDAAKDVDAERWLPMKLRSYYKPSKKERKRGGHQGAVEATASTPAPAAAKSKKKKKKGKK